MPSKDDITELYRNQLDKFDDAYHQILNGEDVRNYIITRITKEEISDETDISSFIYSIFHKVSEDYYFIFELPPTRVMGILLLTIEDDIRKNNNLISQMSADGNVEEMENISKSIEVLDKRYRETIKSVQNTRKMLDQSSSAMTLAEREREYFEYQRGRKRRDKKREILEERIVIDEKVEENKRLGLDPLHGLQDILKSEEHEDYEPGTGKNFVDQARDSLMEKIRKSKEQSDVGSDNTGNSKA